MLWPPTVKIIKKILLATTRPFISEVWRSSPEIWLTYGLRQHRNRSQRLADLGRLHNKRFRQRRHETMIANLIFRKMIRTIVISEQRLLMVSTQPIKQNRRLFQALENCHQSTRLDVWISRFPCKNSIIHCTAGPERNRITSSPMSLIPGVPPPIFNDHIAGRLLSMRQPYHSYAIGSFQSKICFRPQLVQ